MNRTIYWIYNPTMKCPNGYYHGGDYYHLEPGQIAEIVKYVPTQAIIHLLEAELENANYHSMMGTYQKLYDILTIHMDAQKVNNVFLHIWKDGGLFDA